MLGQQNGTDSPTQFGEDSAKALLRDIIEKNDSQAAQLGAVFCKFFGASQGKFGASGATSGA
jgi:hypothetical protein